MKNPVVESKLIYLWPGQKFYSILPHGRFSLCYSDIRKPTIWGNKFLDRTFTSRELSMLYQFRLWKSSHLSLKDPVFWSFWKPKCKMRENDPLKDESLECILDFFQAKFLNLSQNQLGTMNYRKSTRSYYK